jgi:hypothetical protein
VPTDRTSGLVHCLVGVLSTADQKVRSRTPFEVDDQPSNLHCNKQSLLFGSRGNRSPVFLLSVVVKPRDAQDTCKKESAPSGGYSTGGEQRSDEEVTARDKTHVADSPEVGEVDGEGAESKDAIRPVAAALLENPLPHRSRQRPRHPETKPPPPDELRRLMEQSKAMKEELEVEDPDELLIVEEPNENDVLLGRGRRCTEHHGNVLFREFVRERREEYNLAWK